MFVGFSDKLDLFQKRAIVQKDCSVIDTDDHYILIYGYPYLLGEDKYSWVSLNDMLELYKKYSTNLVKKIDGVFTIFIHDKQSRVFYVITDCFGLYSPFYYKGKGMIYISDQIEELLPHLLEFEVNEKTLCNSLISGYGFRFGDETHIKGTFTFRRGSIYTFTSDQKSSREIYWSGVEKQGVRLDTFYKHLKKHFQKMMQLEGKKTFTVSGGYDTSTVISSVLDQDFELASFGMEKSNDMKSARKIAKTFRKKLTPYILDKNFIENIMLLAETNPYIFNGLTPHIHYLEFLWMVFGEAKKSDILYLGFLGDEIWRLCGMNSNFIERFRIKDILDSFKNYSGDDIYNFFDDTTKPSIISFLIDSYASNFGSNLVKFIGKNMKVFMGLINKDILEKLNSEKISWVDRISGKVQKDFIEQNNKKLFNILKKAKKTNPLKISMNRAYRKLFNKDLFKNYPSRPHIFDVWLREYYGNYISDLFIDNINNQCISKIFIKNKIQEIVQKYLDGNNKFFEFVMTLLSTEIWLKKIIGKYEVMY